MSTEHAYRLHRGLAGGYAATLYDGITPLLPDDPRVPEAMRATHTVPAGTTDEALRDEYSASWHAVPRGACGRPHLPPTAPHAITERHDMPKYTCPLCGYTTTYGNAARITMHKVVSHSGAAPVEHKGV